MLIQTICFKFLKETNKSTLNILVTLISIIKFNKIDTNGSGTIEIEELHEVLRVKMSLDFDDGLMQR